MCFSWHMKTSIICTLIVVGLLPSFACCQVVFIFSYYFSFVFEISVGVEFDPATRIQSSVASVSLRHSFAKDRGSSKWMRAQGRTRTYHTHACNYKDSELCKFQILYYPQPKIRE
jgi:hypothetical protein